jgi:hypothetical protein
MQITDDTLNRQFTPAGRRFNCEGYPAYIADRVRRGIVHNPVREDLKIGAIIRGGHSGTMLRNIINVDAHSVSYGWWIPVSETDLVTPPPGASQLGGTCSVDDFLDWACDVIRPGVV